MSDLTDRDIEQHLRAARHRLPDARVLAFHLPEGRVDTRELIVDDEPWHLVDAPSELAIRAALVDHSARQKGRLAIVTSLNTRELSLDVRSRFPSLELLAFDPWQSLKPLFEATTLDWSLTGKGARHLGRALLRAVPPEGFPRVDAGILDVDTAWQTYLRFGLGIPELPHSLADLFPHARTLTSHSHDDEPELREQLIDYLRGRLGAATPLLFAAGEHAIPIGLAAHTAFQAHRNDDSLSEAAAILRRSLEKEYFPGFTAPQLDALPAFAREAADAFKALPPNHQHHTIAQLDQILLAEAASDAPALAVHSPFSDLGWKARHATAARTLQDPDSTTRDLQRALESLERHHNATRHPGLLQTLHHATRLANWLSHQPEPPEPTTRHLATRYIQDHSFADSLRETLTFRDPGPELAPAIDALLKRALDRSEAFNQAFATELTKELSADTAATETLGIHQVLGEVIAPLAADKNVLLIVLDGMSWSVARTLLRDPTLESFDTWVPAHHGRIKPVLTTLPSVTAFSRTALLTGRLQPGEASKEKRQFPVHPALKKALWKRRAAIFHKAELDAAGSGNIGPQVSAAIDDPEVGIVAVVVNAIDDQLSASEQVTFDWSIDAITPLRSLLERSLDRTVVLASDHGHVWETDTEKIRDVGATSQRHRSSDVPPGPGELLVEGPVVKALTGEKSLVLPWSEKVRYTGGRRGYHGGASAQEIVTPLLVLTRHDEPLPADRFARHTTAPPAWWRFESPQAVLPATGALPDTPAPAPAPTASAAQLDLLSKPAPTTLIDRLLATRTFHDQCERFGPQLSDHDILTTLHAIRANNDRASIALLARHTGRSQPSTLRFLTALARTLNRDGYPVLEIDRAQQTARLHIDLLKTQFEL